MPDQPQERKAVYVIADRAGAKSRWIRVGIAFPNRDGSLNVLLDALPVNGKLHVREFAKDETGDEAAEGAPAA